MTQTTLRYQGLSGKSLLFVDPADTRDSVRIQRSLKNKSVGDKNVQNVVTSVNLVRVRDVHLCEPAGSCPAGTENVSFRLDISGSSKNAVGILSDWTDFKALVDGVIADGALTGLLPSQSIELHLTTKE